MKVCFRTDSSRAIGSGHLMRCLTLANVLRARGAEVSFVCRNLPGNLSSLVVEQGHELALLPVRQASDAPTDSALAHADWVQSTWQADARETIDRMGKPAWLIVDHYALDGRWESSVQPHVERIMVLDDLADRFHSCHVLLDQNFYVDQETRYDKLLPQGSLQLLGTRFAILRPEFALARRSLRPRTGHVGRILVFFGASDAGSNTLKVLDALRLLDRGDVEVKVIIGTNSPDRQGILDCAAAMQNVSCLDFVADMAPLMAWADLYVGAAGTTTWERCCLGLPSLIITVSRNQTLAVRDLEIAGAARVLGEGESLYAQDIAACLQSAMGDADTMAKYSRISMDMVDGRGAERCVDAMLQYKEQE